MHLAARFEQRRELREGGGEEALAVRGVEGAVGQCDALGGEAAVEHGEHAGEVARRLCRVLVVEAECEGGLFAVRCVGDKEFACARVK